MNVREVSEKCVWEVAGSPLNFDSNEVFQILTPMSFFSNGLDFDSNELSQIQTPIGFFKRQS